MIVINADLTKKELIYLHKYFRDEREKILVEIENHIERYETPMNRESMITTKYKHVWDEYKLMLDRFIECKTQLDKIVYFLSYKNKENNAAERTRHPKIQ